MLQAGGLNDVSTSNHTSRKAHSIINKHVFFSLGAYVIENTAFSETVAMQCDVTGNYGNYGVTQSLTPSAFIRS